MNVRMVCGALALGLMAVPGVALADDPYDPSMRTQRARERDRAIIRKLNQQELARVRERDARYAEGWSQWRNGRQDDRADDYAQAQREHEARMAQWRRAVAACRAGHYEYCAR